MPDLMDNSGTLERGPRPRGRPRKYPTAADYYDTKLKRERERRAAWRARGRELRAPPSAAPERAEFLELARTHPNVAKGLQYVEDVLDGCVPAGRLARLACERHIRDMERVGGVCHLLC